MTRMIVLSLTLGLLATFTLPTLTQETIPPKAKFKAKTIQWLAPVSDLLIISEAKERYALHLHLPVPAIEKEGTGNERQLLLFPYVYEAVLQQRFITMLSHKIAFGTNRYDEGRNQGEKKEDRPKRGVFVATQKFIILMRLHQNDKKSG